MKIGIDCRMWNETGVGRYIRNIVRELSVLDQQNEYVLFFMEDTFEQVELPNNFKKVKANIRWHTFAEQLKLPWIFFKENLDLLHVPHFNVPILYPRSYVSTIHDLTILRVNTGRATTKSYPMIVLWRVAFRLVLLSTILRSKYIFTVTNSVKEDLIETFGIKREKLVVSPAAVSKRYKKTSSEEIVRVKEKYNLNKPYLYYVGNAHPHKNLERLIEAFEIISKRDNNLLLALGGKKDFFYTRLEDEWKDKPIYEKVRFLGFVDEEDMPALYSGAEAFVNPSMYEGFGIQLLEGFSCGTKMVCSNTTSLPEVGGDAAYYFDPRSVDNIAETVLFALQDNNEEKVRLGYDRVKHYSWKESAKTVLSVYNSVLHKLPLKK